MIDRYIAVLGSFEILNERTRETVAKATSLTHARSIARALNLIRPESDESS